MINKLSSVSAIALLASANLFAQPIPTPPQSAGNKFMHGSDFNELVARFEDPARAQWQKPGEVIANLGPLDGKTVADIGTGSGYFALPLAKKAIKVIAIDASTSVSLITSSRRSRPRKPAATSKPV